MSLLLRFLYIEDEYIAPLVISIKIERKVIGMTRDEVLKLLTISQSYYHSFKVNQRKVDDWHDVLKGYSFETLKKNLRAHVTKSVYPPSVKELISGPYRDPGTRAVANRPESELFSQAKH